MAPISAPPDKCVVMQEEGRQSESLPPAQAGAMAGVGGAGGLLRKLGLAFLTFNSGLAIYLSFGNKGSVALVAFSYMDLVALFFCLRQFERAPPAGSTTRRRLKVAVWALTTALTFVFSFKVTAVMPVPVQVVVWLMAVATALGGFYAFFLHSDKGKKGTGFLLATLRSSQETASSSRDHDLREAAWSGTRLIVDSGATRHAVGDVRLLENYQRYNPPLVATQADGSNLRTNGIGHIQRDNFSIPNVRFVEGVQDVLISTPQLDYQHRLISCFGNGEYRIMEVDGTVVGGSVLEEDGFYVLRFLQVPVTAHQQ